MWGPWENIHHQIQYFLESGYVFWIVILFKLPTYKQIMFLKGLNMICQDIFIYILSLIRTMERISDAKKYPYNIKLLPLFLGTTTVCRSNWSS